MLCGGTCEHDRVGEFVSFGVRHRVGYDWVVDAHKDERRDISKRTGNIDLVDEAEVCGRQVATKHDRHLERDWSRLGQVDGNHRCALRKSEDSVEWPLVGDDPVEVSNRCGCPCRVGGWLALAARRIANPQPTGLWCIREDEFVLRKRRNELLHAG